MSFIIYRQCVYWAVTRHFFESSMMKYLTLTFLLLVSCQEKKEKALHSIDNKEKRQILISSGQFEPYETIKINNIDFDLVVNETADTIYLGTKDTNFTTADGFTVGAKFGELSNDLKKEISKENGWGYYVTLNSGWSLGFCEGSSCTDNYPADSSRVKWIFRRK